ncbi:MAG: DUF2520 domain-containing protein [Desulfobacterota bacterium]|nr:DUF2520 domain-containing protein [Thermodesulfobacteriota bacterium]MDW8002194.1 DUF2520 domain-containing protein [Deltaproteobacteria bacterium]
MRLGIIGAGKVGISISYVLKSKGIDLYGVSSRREEALALAKNYLGESLVYTTDNFEIVQACDVIGITTQDKNISVVAKAISDSFLNLKGKIFFHTSGSHSLGPLLPLKEKGAALGSIHPLQTFPDVESAITALPKTYVFVEGEEEAMPVLENLAQLIGFRVYRIESEKKVIYHLAAVFVCNLLCALLYAGSNLIDMIGFDLQPFYPIIETTIKNVKEKGPVHSLTGPVVRGDVETIKSHIEILKNMPDHLSVYSSLSVFALEIAKKRRSIDPQTEREIEEILSELRR